MLRPKEGPVTLNQEEMAFLTTLIGVTQDQGLPQPGGLVMPDLIAVGGISEKNQLMSLEKLFEDKVTDVKLGRHTSDDYIKTNVRLIQDSGGSTMGPERKETGVEKGEMKAKEVIRVSSLSNPAEEDGLRMKSSIKPSDHTTQKAGGDPWIEDSKTNTRLILESRDVPMDIEQKGSGIEKGGMKSNEVIKVSSLSNLAREPGRKLENTTLSFDHTMEKTSTHPETEEGEKRLLMKLRVALQKIAGETDKAINYPNQNRSTGGIDLKEPPPNLNINLQRDVEISKHPSKDQPLERVLLKTEPDLQNIEVMAKRIDVLPMNRAGNEAAGIDSVSRENTLSFQNSQNQERIPETMSAAKEIEFFKKPLRTIVLKQMVERAAMDLNGGRTAIKINLKPEYLGYLRMEISTDNHQVMVKIMTEIPLVKEIIENNINQLKAALAGHGLEMDDLDVFVAHDSDKHEGRSGDTELTNMENALKEEKIGDILPDEEHVIQLAAEMSEKNLINFFV